MRHNLVEAFRMGGANAEECDSIEFEESIIYGQEHVKTGRIVSKKSILVRTGAYVFLVVPTHMFKSGEIAEEWNLGTGSPPSVPKTILVSRDGECLFLHTYQDVKSQKWPTSPVVDVMKRTSIESETEFITSVLSHPAGYHIGIFGMLEVRSCSLSGSVMDNISFEVSWDTEDGSTKNENFSTASEAAAFFVEKRKSLRLGVDYEKEDIEDSRPTQKIDL